jgi:excisionase family DNA binding protein
MQEDNEPNEPVMTVAEFARRAGVTRNTVYDWMDKGYVRTVMRVGRRWLPESELAYVPKRAGKP